MVDTGDPTPVRWHAVSWSRGVLDVAVLEPDAGTGPGPHPVIVALPWGAGTADLVLGLVETYWSPEPASRGYYVVAPVVVGSSLATSAPELYPALFEWMERDLDADLGRVVLTGASNGGRGVFYSALAHPHRFAALIGMPGRYEGEPADLASLAGKPVWLLVGQYDDGWVAAVESTHQALVSQGAHATLEIVSNQGHVLRLSQARLMDWIEGALSR